MNKFLLIALLSSLAASADIIPAMSLKNGATYFIYDAHGDDGTSTAHDRDTNYRYAFRYDDGDEGIAGNHVKAATAIAEGRTFSSLYVWRAVEVGGKWQFENVGTSAFVTGGTITGNSPATMELEPTDVDTRFTLRMAGSANNRWDGDYNRTGAFWNYQYHYPFVWWEGEGHPYEFYEATLTAADTYAFTDHDRSQISLIAQRALELKNIGLISDSAYNAAAPSIVRANSNDDALDAFNSLLATINSVHIILHDQVVTLTPEYRLFIEYTNSYLPGTHRFTAVLGNIADGTLRLNNSDVVIQVVSAADAAAEHLAGALDNARDWQYSPEPGHMSVSDEAYAALTAARAAQGQDIATMRQAADALFAADPTMEVNLPMPGQSYAINYRYTFGLTYSNYLTATGHEVTTTREPSAWELVEGGFLRSRGAMLNTQGGWHLAATGTPLQILRADVPDADGIYPFTIQSADGALAFEFHIMKTDVLLDSDPMPVYFTITDPEQSSITELCGERRDSTPIYNLQGLPIACPTHGIYIINGKKQRL